MLLSALAAPQHTTLTRLNRKSGFIFTHHYSSQNEDISDVERFNSAESMQRNEVLIVPHCCFQVAT